MVCAPLVNGLALLWVAVEITTVVSALLVAIDDTEGAAEAAWKYVLIASSGLGIALLATIVMYYAGPRCSASPTTWHSIRCSPRPAAAGHAQCSWRSCWPSSGSAPRSGLFPVHTWLPDAHAEAPTPGVGAAVRVAAGGELLRDPAVLPGDRGARSAGSSRSGSCWSSGSLSLLLAALYRAGAAGRETAAGLLQRGTHGHPGASASGSAPRWRSPGCCCTCMAHAAAKGNAFMGAGVLVRKFGTKQLVRIRSAIDVLPWSGPLFLLAILALSAMPPFGIFRSEFQIVAGGLGDGHSWAGGALVVLVTLAFVGLTASTTRMLFTSSRDGTGQPGARTTVEGPGRRPRSRGGAAPVDGAARPRRDRGAHRARGASAGHL